MGANAKHLSPFFKRYSVLLRSIYFGLHSPSQTANKGTVSSKECSERRESQVTAVRAHYSFVSIASVTFWALDDGTFTDFMRFL